jgi:uracil-DNA glycosylase family 4
MTSALSHHATRTALPEIPPPPRTTGDSDPFESLARQIRLCTACPLSQSRRLAVPGEGTGIAPVMFVGEAPGTDEDRIGRPFVGAAGRLLTSLLEEIGIDRADCRIENTVRCKPPHVSGHITPPPAEAVARCRPFLDRAIEIAQPRILVPMGATALAALLPHAGRISTAHGRAFWDRQKSAWIFPMFHPAWALRSRRPDVARAQMRRDMARLRHLMRVDHMTRRRPWSAYTLALLMESFPFFAPQVDPETATVSWNTDGLHPMFRTPSAITELMSRATGLPLRRYDDAIAGVITTHIVSEASATP